MQAHLQIFSVVEIFYGCKRACMFPTRDKILFKNFLPFFKNVNATAQSALTDKNVDSYRANAWA